MCCDVDAGGCHDDRVRMLVRMRRAARGMRSSPSERLPIPAREPGGRSRGGVEHHGPGLPESVNEALFLFITAGLGLLLNVVVISCILISRRQRRVTNAFVVHGCALDALKCAYCVPFATSLLRDVAPGFCAVLGGSVLRDIRLRFDCRSTVLRQ